MARVPPTNLLLAGTALLLGVAATGFEDKHTRSYFAIRHKISGFEREKKR
jgi:hypothetical protein